LPDARCPAAPSARETLISSGAAGGAPGRPHLVQSRNRRIGKPPLVGGLGGPEAERSRFARERSASPAPHPSGPRQSGGTARRAFARRGSQDCSVKRITSPPFFAPTFSAPTIARRVTPVQSVQKLCVPAGARRDGVPPGQRADAAPAGGSPLPDETCEKVGRAIFTLRISPREVGVLTPPLVSCVAAERRLAPVVTHMAVDMTGPEARAASLPPAPVNSRAAESKSPHDPPYLPSGPARQPGNPATSSRKPLTARHAVRATVPKDHAPATPSFRKTGAAQAGSHAKDTTFLRTVLCRWGLARRRS
jgi:hypothetical protein